jgi:hypothetical protein
MNARVRSLRENAKKKKIWASEHQRFGVEFLTKYIRAETRKRDREQPTINQFIAT